MLTSDTDRITVRELYGSTREMVITWAQAGAPACGTGPSGGKMFMACNTPPTFANVDAAILARCQYVPFESSFSDQAPETAGGVCVADASAAAGRTV